MQGLLMGANRKISHPRTAATAIVVLANGSRRFGSDAGWPGIFAAADVQIAILIPGRNGAIQPLLNSHFLPS